LLCMQQAMQEQGLDPALAQRLVQVVEALLGAPAPEPHAHGQAGARVGQPPAPPTPSDGGRSRVQARARVQATPANPERVRRAAPAPRRHDRVEVESVLPFVVLGILSRQRYFDGLRAALSCTDTLEQSACFAAAVAYKLCPPPRHGWARSAATRQLAALLCGLEQAPDNVRMDGFLRALSPACAPLDASFWWSAERARKSPGILIDACAGGQWAMLDIASSQVLGWWLDLDALLRSVDLLPGRLWWLGSAAAASPLPAALDGRGLRAVALGAPPGPGWCSAGAGLWTNHALLRRHGVQLARVFDEAGTLLAATHRELVTRRPLVIAARATPMRMAECSITLAVCSALHQLAHTLWHGRERLDAALALERFADFGGSVTNDGARVLVRPALGRRYMDLSKHGLLRDIVGLPWWPGVRVEFAGP
ncbi:MAG: hypothetical protein ACLGI6_06990, partial [Gammaproteobacteria bacterium]